MWIKKLFLCFTLIFCKVICQGQETGLSPELKQMYRNVEQYRQLGNYKDAIITLKQLLVLAPGHNTLITELGNLYYVSGEYSLAAETLEPLMKEPHSSDTVFQLLAASQMVQKEFKKANNTLNKGQAGFPSSCMLFYRRGQLCMLQQDNDAAIQAWQAGIQACPGEPLNYLEAARAYLNTDNKIEGLMLGEAYLAMRSDTAGNDSVKKMIFEGWKNYFVTLADKKPGKNTGKGSAQIIDDYYRMLTPVVSDGITTENLTMVRTRLLMEWVANQPRPGRGDLFEYQDDLIRNGRFDMYNEWLFGKAEHEGQYNAWLKFHDYEMEQFLKWRSANPFKPVPFGK